MHPVFAGAGEQAVPILFATGANFSQATQSLDARARAFVQAAGFEPKAGKHLLVPDAQGKLAAVLFGLEEADDPARDLFRPGALAGLLPAGSYRFANPPHDARLAALAFALGSYQFSRYRKAQERNVLLVVPDGVDGEELSRIAEAVTLARDLTNTPSNDMGPAELETAARALAAQHKMSVQVTSGADLAKNFPLVAAVGAGSARQPRLIDLTWGNDSDPKITLVGKGVCFDTGGLDLKPASGMLNMKKDMSGAAIMLGLGQAIMAAGLKVRLRVLLPCVENSVAGNAMRPRDIVRTRKGLTVEIGNTDAEGRLIQCDALADAADEKPEMIVDCATLTGAARVALGPELPALFCNDDTLANALIAAGAAEDDPMWRMPLCSRASMFSA